MRLDALTPAHAEWEQRPLVLETAEVAFDNAESEVAIEPTHSPDSHYNRASEFR